MTYGYRAYTRDKKVVRGTLEAASEGMAEAALYRAGYQHVLSLREIKPGPTLESLVPSLFGIKGRDVIEFSQQLATLLDSGLPILTALRLLRGQVSGSAMKRTLGGVIEEIEGGNSLSAALGRYPRVFSDTFRQVLRASEQTGNLEVGLKQVADHLEGYAASRQKITRAIIYPALVVLLAVSVVILLVTVALPPLAGLFTSLGAELPATTRLLIGLVDFTADNRLYLLGGLVALAAAFTVYFRLPAGRFNLDRLLLKLPVAGRISLERNMQQFCRIASLLLKAGLGLPRTIELATGTVSNRVVRRALKDVSGNLLQGQGLSRPMSEDPLFPPLMVEMLTVGENTGTIDGTLATLAGYYERRVDQRVAVLTSLIEPLLTAAIGVVVIFIAMSMITPLYSILRSIH